MNRIWSSCQLGQALHLAGVPRTVGRQGKPGDSQRHVLRLIFPQDMFTGVQTQRAICHGDHHDRKWVGEQAQWHGLAIRESTIQLVGRTLERYPVRARTIQMDRDEVRTLTIHDLCQMLTQQVHQLNTGRKGRHVLNYDF